MSGAKLQHSDSATNATESSEGPALGVELKAGTGQYFSLGAQLELDAALSWLANSSTSQLWQQGQRPADWPLLVCQLCRPTTATRSSAEQHSGQQDNNRLVGPANLDALQPRRVDAAASSSETENEFGHSDDCNASFWLDGSSGSGSSSQEFQQALETLSWAANDDDEFEWKYRPLPTPIAWVRPIALTAQIVSLLLTLMLIGVILRIRKSRLIIVSGWLMLETMLVGALILYAGVLVRYFQPTSLTCLLEPWFRELGFSIFYGSIMIKLYRILTEFQTRKAHRVCLREKDQMVYLLAIVLIVIGYMSAWTALMVDGFFVSRSETASGSGAPSDQSEPLIKLYQPVSESDNNHVAMLLNERHGEHHLELASLKHDEYDDDGGDNDDDHDDNYKRAVSMGTVGGGGKPGQASKRSSMDSSIDLGHRKARLSRHMLQQGRLKGWSELSEETAAASQTTVKVRLKQRRARRAQAELLASDSRRQLHVAPIRLRHSVDKLNAVGSSNGQRQPGPSLQLALTQSALNGGGKAAQQQQQKQLNLSDENRDDNEIGDETGGQTGAHLRLNSLANLAAIVGRDNEQSDENNVNDSDGDVHDNNVTTLRAAHVAPLSSSQSSTLQILATQFNDTEASLGGGGGDARNDGRVHSHRRRIRRQQQQQEQQQQQQQASETSAETSTEATAFSFNINRNIVNDHLEILARGLNSFGELFLGLLESEQHYDHESDALVYVIRCRKLTWDYVTESSEIALLLFGVHLVYKLRNASVEVHKEKTILSLAIFIELLLSLFVYLVRHLLWSKLSADHLLIMHSLRCQLTVTFTVAMVFGPKLWRIAKTKPGLLMGALFNYPVYQHECSSGASCTDGEASGASGSLGGSKRPHNMRHRCHISCEVHDHHLGDASRLQQAMLSNSALEIGTINLADMDPEDIQAELKRVYTQLEVLKTKVMRRDNPHISKRRGGRKPGHRKFSLQAFHNRHSSSGEHHHSISSSGGGSTSGQHGAREQGQGSSGSGSGSSGEQTYPGSTGPGGTGSRQYQQGCSGQCVGGYQSSSMAGRLPALTELEGETSAAGTSSGGGAGIDEDDDQSSVFMQFKRGTTSRGGGGSGATSSSARHVRVDDTVLEYNTADRSECLAAASFDDQRTKTSRINKSIPSEPNRLNKINRNNRDAHLHHRGSDGVVVGGGGNFTNAGEQASMKRNHQNCRAGSMSRPVPDLASTGSLVYDDETVMNESPSSGEVSPQHRLSMS